MNTGALKSSSAATPHQRGPRPPGVRERDDPALATLLIEFHRRLSEGDVNAAAALWDVPALILGDDHVHGPLSRDRLAEMLADAPGADPLEQLALEGAPELLIDDVTWSSSRVALIEARWPRLARGSLLDDAAAGTFLVRIDEHGHPKIRGLVLRGTPRAPT